MCNKVAVFDIRRWTSTLELTSVHHKEYINNGAEGREGTVGKKTVTVLKKRGKNGQGCNRICGKGGKKWKNGQIRKRST